MLDLSCLVVFLMFRVLLAVILMVVLVTAKIMEVLNVVDLILLLVKFIMSKVIMQKSVHFDGVSLMSPANLTTSFCCWLLFGLHR